MGRWTITVISIEFLSGGDFLNKTKAANTISSGIGVKKKTKRLKKENDISNKENTASIDSETQSTSEETKRISSL